MANKEEEKKEGEEAPKPKSKKKLIIIIVPVVLVILGVVGFLVLGGKKPEVKEGEEAGQAQHEAVAKKLQIIKLEPFVVNLSENTSFLKTSILIEFDPVIMEKATGATAAKGAAHGGGAAGEGEKKAESPESAVFTEREPMIRDAIIRVLASKKVQDVITTDGKEKLKEELIEAVNEALDLAEDPVVNIYFVDFIIQ